MDDHDSDTASESYGLVLGREEAHQRGGFRSSTRPNALFSSTTMSDEEFYVHQYLSQNITSRENQPIEYHDHQDNVHVRFKLFL